MSIFNTYNSMFLLVTITNPLRFCRRMKGPNRGCCPAGESKKARPAPAPFQEQGPCATEDLSQRRGSAGGEPIIETRGKLKIFAVRQQARDHGNGRQNRRRKTRKHRVVV